MRKLVEKIRKYAAGRPRLDPGNPIQRKQIIEAAVKRTIKEYGEALKRLGSE